MSVFIVDLQGFQIFDHADNITFICKEIAVLNIDTNSFDHKIFLPPYPFSDLNTRSRKNVLWLSNKYHNLKWTSGNINYNLLKNATQNMFSYDCKIYVKGADKIKWLNNILGLHKLQIINIESFGCPSLKELNASSKLNLCKSHLQNCALRNVFLLKDWYKQRFNSLVSFKKFNEDGILHFMLEEEITCLPMEFIMAFAPRQINEVWNKFPKSWQEDKEFQKYLRCTNHPLIADSNADQVGNVYPIKKYCLECNKM